MPGLLGLYDRAGGSAGILINSNHPLALQRFTAAHEYGHHVLGHDASSDDERTIDRIDDPNIADQETAAQAFAAEFLIPQKLVNHTLRRLHLSPEPDALDAPQVYRLSVEVGASYTATVHQLRTLKMVSLQRASYLLGQRPIDIKEALLGERPDDLARIDVWDVRPEQDGQTLFPHVGDRVRLQFSEVPSTGYRWAIEPAGRLPSGLALTADRFQQPAGRGIGGRGVRSFSFSIRDAGRHQLHFVCRRPWDPGTAASASFDIALVARVRSVGVAERGLVEHQREYLIASGF
jgi:predicted secreted protein